MWSTYDFAAMWVGLSVVITTYTLARVSCSRAWRGGTPGGQVADPGVFDHLYTYAWFVTSR